jgi:hypothetical protein
VCCDQEWQGEVDRTSCGAFEFADFLQLMALKSREPDTEEDLEKAFLVRAAFAAAAAAAAAPASHVVLLLLS